MTNYVGYIFTDTYLQLLKQKGLKGVQNPQIASESYRAFYFPFLDNKDQLSCIVLHRILDEKKYLQEFSLENFNPRICQENMTDLDLLPHLNSGFRLLGPVDILEIDSKELHDYLYVRKNFSLRAICLKVMDFETFCDRAHPDYMTTWHNQAVGLIHMNPSCFDLLIKV